MYLPWPVIMTCASIYRGRINKLMQYCEKLLDNNDYQPKVIPK
jgi:hypothetical protein